MRPEQLVLDNVGSFRGRHVVDFRAVELFVLSGPTGAGKSTIIDALTLALYGSVARYDNANLIEPVINKLATQATVSLTFTTGDRRYVVTRLIARTPAGGASAREVRLEQVRGDGTTTAVASGSREVDGAVAALLGLTFDEFCKTVVLPQGAFAQFLHGGRRERQELLVRLLGLEVYQRIGQAARTQAQALDVRIDAVEERLRRIADATQAAVDAAVARAARLRTARATVVEELIPALDDVRERWHTARVTCRSADHAVVALEGLVRPDGVEDLAARVRAADDRVRAAEGALAEARSRRDAAFAARRGTPPAAPAEVLRAADARLAAAIEDRTTADDAAALATAAARTVEVEAADARTAAEAAAAAHDEVRDRHRAHDLASRLGAGDDCPVCLRPVDEVPRHEPPPGLQAVADAAAAADATARRAEAGFHAAAGRAQVAVGRSQAAAARVDDLRAALRDAAEACGIPLVGARADLAACAARIDAAARAEEAAERADAVFATAEARLAEARRARGILDEAAADSWRQLDAARDAVAALGAPALDRRDDIAAAWDALLTWAVTQLRTARRAQQQAHAELAAAEDAGREHTLRIGGVVTEAGVAVADGARPEAMLEALLTAIATADADVAHRTADLEERTRLAAERRRLAADRDVAELVGRLLRRDQFEAWLLNRLSTRLVAGASRILADLTEGAFSLAVDAGSGAFEVVDHLNADERRSAKTLSGGESFLASLALALALAEHVAQVDKAGAGRLDALFLDEGFGTLDAETLDTVASAIEELSGARMVGVITHVRELAARIPYRYDVTRGPHGSQIAPAAPDDTPAALPGQRR